MLLVELLGLGRRPAHALLRDDTQAGLLDDRIDAAGQIARRGVGFDDGECTLDGHLRSLSWSLWRVGPRYSFTFPHQQVSQP